MGKRESKEGVKKVRDRGRKEQRGRERGKEQRETGEERRKEGEAEHTLQLPG